MKHRVAVVGVSGYSGLELIRILLEHPAAECVAVTASESSAGKPLPELHPALRGRTELRCLPHRPEELADLGPDTVFLCTPNEVSHEWVPPLIRKGIRVIDLSGSYRLRNAALYPEWYGFPHRFPSLLGEAVYGLPEWNAAALSEARLVANPGCYPTAVLLALLPLMRGRLLEPGSEILCDAKSGVTGAGRSARLEMLFGEVSENFRPYSPIRHRHAPEIVQELGWIPEDFTFVPHLLPANRGILATMYVRFREALRTDELQAVYRQCYGGEPFIRLLDGDSLPELRAVVQSNYCDIAWRVTAGGRRGVIFSAIDNLVKGAAGQAMQNFNHMHGLPPGSGLTRGEAVENNG